MQKQELKSYYDVVVIGSGVGGLTAAALLSKAGFSVCVLEKETRIGGYLAGFRRGNFMFDTAIHWLNQCAPDGLVGKLFDALGNDHPIAVPQTRIRRYKGDSYDYLLTNNPDQFKKRLIDEFPHEKKGIEKFFHAAKRLGNSFKRFNDIFRTEETMSFVERIKNKSRLLKFALPFIPYISYTGEKGLKKGLNRFFRDENIHKIFTGETELLSCLIPIGWAYFGDFQSPPRGGSQTIPQWLQHIINYYGNPVCLKAPVTKILLDGDRCTGVSFKYNNTDHSIASKYVIAACDVEALYERMLPENAVPDRMKNNLRRAELYSSSVTVSIALDCATEDLGFDEEMIHVACEKLPFDAHSSGDPLKGEISILAPSLRDKSLAPSGNGTLTLYMPAFMDYKNNWLTEKDQNGNYIRGEEYKKLKNEIAEVLIKRVEEILKIELRPHILFYEVATPVTHWRYTGNRNGSIMGAKPGRINMQLKVAHYRAPVKNLILGGHWAELGGGVPIAVKAGTNAALLVFKKENKKALNLLSGYMDNKILLEELLKDPCFKSYDNSWKQPLTPAERVEERGLKSGSLKE
ncbi:MAG TPA: NAD(P)/FAD-dependent oxidoreductase [Puia sp.]|nr:NAD(P)/FAD-dependent oxidoreductase [Puia sp.]